MAEPIAGDQNISIVIATLGGDCLSATIDSLMAGSKKPGEILICIPEAQAYKVSSLASATVKIIATQVKGQVKQRAFGFTQTIHPFVMQLDDDILFEKNTLQKLVGYLVSLGPGNVIGPVYYGHRSKRCIHELQDGFGKNIFDCVICAAPWGEKKMGVVTSIGLNYGVDDRYCAETVKQTEWLPGGCVLSFRENLITTDFFPFEGKAYCEDIFHSFYRSQKGIQHFVAADTRVFIEEPEPEFSKNAVDKVIMIRRKLVELTGGSRMRLFLYECFCKIRSRFYSSGK